MEIDVVLEGQRLGKLVANGDLMRNGVPVNEEVSEVADWHDEVMDPQMVAAGRKDEVEFMVDRLNMFEWGT